MNLISYTIYDTATGQIVMTRQTTRDPALWLEEGHAYLTGVELDGKQWRVEAGVAVPLTRPVEDVRAEAVEEVDRRAEALRHLYITPGDGQAMVYREKGEEARAYNALTAPERLAVDPADYPMLNADAAATSRTLEAVATEVAAIAATWRTVAGEIEKLRLGAKRTIANSTDAAVISAAPDGVTLAALEAALTP